MNAPVPCVGNFFGRSVPEDKIYKKEDVKNNPGNNIVKDRETTVKSMRNGYQYDIMQYRGKNNDRKGYGEKQEFLLQRQREKHQNKKHLKQGQQSGAPRIHLDYLNVIYGNAEFCIGKYFCIEQRIKFYRYARDEGRKRKIQPIENP